MNSDFLHEDLSGRIIGAAMTVLTALKPGLDERLHENALVIKLNEQGLRAEQQRRCPVDYRNQRIGLLIPDLIVNGVVIVDPKSRHRFSRRTRRSDARISCHHQP